MQGSSIRQNKTIEGPTTSACQQLHSVHIQLIYIGAFFTINLDADKMFVHYGCCVFVFKALALHHMAPMASRVANTHQYQLVFAFGLLKSLFAPLNPVYRVVGML